MIALLLAALQAAPAAAAPGAPAPAATPAQREAAQRAAAQRAAMAPLARFDGRWRGRSTADLPDGTRRELQVNYRSGPMLGGAVRLSEGRSFGPDGRLAINLLSVAAHDPATGETSLRVHYGGRIYHHRLTLTPTGYTFTVRPPDGAVIAYTVVNDGRRWEETGMRSVGGAPAVRSFHMVLERVGDSDWPGDGGPEGGPGGASPPPGRRTSR